MRKEVNYLWLLNKWTANSKINFAEFNKNVSGKLVTNQLRLWRLLVNIWGIVHLIHVSFLNIFRRFSCLSPGSFFLFDLFSTVDVGEDVTEQEEDEEGDEDGRSEEEEEEEEDDDDDGEAPSDGNDSAAETSSKGESTRSSTKSSGGPSLDARAELASNLILLHGLELGHVTSLLERECPKALETVDGGDDSNQSYHDPNHLFPEKVEIVLDAIPSSLFAKVSQYAAEKAMGRKRGLTEDPPLDDVSSKRKRRKTA